MLAVMLFIGYYAETPDPGPPSPGRALAMVLAGCVGLFLASFAINRAALYLLKRKRTMKGRRQIAGIADLLLRMLLVTVYAGCLTVSSLPWSVVAWLGWPVGPDSFLVQMLGLAPYIAMFPAAWLPMYGVHRETANGTWTRLSFIVHKARYNLYMLLAWIPFALLVDWLSGALVILPVVFLAAAWAFPYVLARAWGCTPLPPGEIMDRVRRLEDAAGVRFSRVYVWEPGGGGVQNAAAVGLLPPFRYLFLTPALLRNMKENELDVVIFHELGHVRHRHLLFYMFTTLAGINLAVLAGALIPMLGSGERFLVTAVLVLVYFRVVFGWLSRNMERQADLFALEKSGSAGGLVNALEKLALGAGNIRMAASWHHLGIAERVDFLRAAERRPELARRHNAGVSLLMRLGYALSIVLMGAMVWGALADYQRMSRPDKGAARPVDNGEEAHWRRVMAVSPDNVQARLALAYRLAGREESRAEAKRLAEEVLAMPAGEQTSLAARKLLRDLDGASAE